MFQSAFDQLIGPRGCWHPASRASTTHFPTCNAHHTNRQSRGMPLPYGKEGTPFIYFTPMHLPFLVRKQAYNTLAKSESGPAAQREPVMHLCRSLHDCLAVPVFLPIRLSPKPHAGGPRLPPSSRHLPMVLLPPNPTRVVLGSSYRKGWFSRHGDGNEPKEDGPRTLLHPVSRGPRLRNCA